MNKRLDKEQNVKIQYAIEGILFAAGEPVKAAKLASVLDTDIKKVSTIPKCAEYR